MALESPSSPESLATEFSASGSPNPVESLEIRAPSRLLEAFDLHIDSIDTERTVSEWRESLSLSDYVILLLNAVALLSEREKQFVSEVLAPVSSGTRRGWERIAVVVNKIDLLDSEEQQQALQYVWRFLGPFGKQPAILTVSAKDPG